MQDAAITAAIAVARVRRRRIENENNVRIVVLLKG
jgi:hypothetical protein